MLSINVLKFDVYLKKVMMAIKVSRVGQYCVLLVRHVR